MALIVLTALQAKAAEILVTTAIDALARYQLVKDLTDDQCQVLIANAVETKNLLDKRLAEH
jgi:hypothetical protein